MLIHSLNLTDTSSIDDGQDRLAQFPFMAATSRRGHAAENFGVSGHGQVQIGDRNYYTST
jgi:hypothetical protein